MLITPDQMEDIITPFNSNKVSEVDGNKVMSYGCSGAGYDIRLSTEFVVTHSLHHGFSTLDPKNGQGAIDSGIMVKETHTDAFIIEPHDFLLGVSMEKFVVPDDVVGHVLGKSSYARNGIIANVTPLEPGWKGYLTIEISNTTPFKVILYPGEGIAQVFFFKLPSGATTYSGKYQDQPLEPIVSK